MNIVEEFFIKFASDAPQVSKDMDALNKQIEALAVKGNKRSEEEAKHLKKLRALRAEQLADIKDTTRATDNMGVSLGKIITGGAGALLAFKSISDVFRKIKEGVVNAINYNFELQKTAKLTGISARELSIWDGAVEQAGGSAGEFLGYITRLNEQYAALGINDRIKYVTRDFLTLAKAWEGLTDQQRQQRASLLGLTTGEILLLDQGYDRVTKILRAQEAFNNTSAKTAELGFDIKTEFGLAGKEMYSAFNDALPALKVIADLALVLASAVKIMVDGAAALYRFAQAGFQVFSGNFHGAAKSFGKGLDNLAEAGATGNAAANYLLSGTGKSSLTAPVSSSGSSGGILPLIAKYESGNRNVLNSSGPGGTAESTASGYYQIINGTWRQFAPKAGVSLSQYPRAIDAPFDVQTKVASMIYDEQGLAPWASDSRLMAAAAGGVNAAPIGNLIGAANAGLSQANSAALPSPVSIGGGSFSVGNVTIHSQATDAKGVAQDFHAEMQKEYAQTIGSHDDAVAY